MDKITMKNLGFYGYHGVLAEEKSLGQKFFIDIELYTDLKEAGMTDCLEKTVNYGEVYELVKNIVENRQYDLIEALGENIAKDILKDFILVEEVLVVVRKPEAPIAGIFDYFGIELRRRRNE